MGTDCIVTWPYGAQIIKGAELGDERIAQVLDRLAELRVHNIRIDFVASHEPQGDGHAAD
jgi:hypothetical protein